MGINRFVFASLAIILFIWIVFLLLENNSKYLFYSIIYTIFLMFTSVIMFSDIISIKGKFFRFHSQLMHMLMYFLYSPFNVLLHNQTDRYFYGKQMLVAVPYISFLFLISYCTWLNKASKKKENIIIFFLILSNYISLAVTSLYSQYPFLTKEAAIISCVNFLIWLLAIFINKREMNCLIIFEIILSYLLLSDLDLWINNFIHYIDNNGQFAYYNTNIYFINCNGVQREHNKKLNNGLPILHKVPPKRDYGRYFCIMAKKGGTSHGGLTEKLSPFFHAQKQEVNAYGR